MVPGQAVSLGSARSRAASTSARIRSRARSRSGSAPVIVLGAGQGLRLRAAVLVEEGLAARVLHEHLDLALRLLELAVAEAGEPDALLVELERLLEGQLALLELLDDLLELLQRVLEAGLLDVAHTGSFPVTVAPSVPRWRRRRSGSPTATAAESRTRRRPSACHTRA